MTNPQTTLEFVLDKNVSLQNSNLFILQRNNVTKSQTKMKKRKEEIKILKAVQEGY